MTARDDEVWTCGIDGAVSCASRSMTTVAIFERTEDGRLLAAAPELYRALEACRPDVNGDCPSCGADGNIGCGDDCDIESVLRKARGRK